MSPVGLVTAARITLRRHLFTLKLGVFIAVPALVSVIPYATQNPTVTRLFTLVYAAALVGMAAVMLHAAPAAVRTVRLPKGTLWQALPAEYSALATQMGVERRVSRLGVVPNWTNAVVTRRGELLMGRPLLDALPWDDARGVLAHEFAHLRQSRSLRDVAAIAVLLVLSWSAFASLSSFSLAFWLPAAVGITVVSTTAIFHLRELGADRIAARVVGPETVTRALEALHSLTVDDGPSFTHPSTSRRIAELRGRRGRAASQL
jgi:Zn-dependent protease with chaperone function